MHHAPSAVESLEARRLCAVDLSLSGTLPIGVAGRPGVVASLTIKNQGSTNAFVGVPVSLFLSSNQRLDVNDDLRLASVSLPALRAGQSVSTTIAVPSVGVTSGVFYVIAVVDPDQLQAEASRSNNALTQNSPSVVVPSFGASTWRFNGTSATDVLTITQSSSRYSAVFNGRLITRNVVDVSSIVVQVAGGNDVINLAGVVFAQANVDGGAGNDSISGGVQPDTLAGGSGNDTIRGNAGNDSITGSAGADSLFGGDGNDSLNGGSGRDTLLGENGNDRLSSRDGEVDSLNGGPGSDRAQLDISDLRAGIEELLA